MTRLIVALASVAGCIFAQPYSDLLLPEARHIVGIVIDSYGKPIADARIDHSNDNRHAHQTDSEGRFEFDTKAPALVIRKSGFHSEFLRTQDPIPLRITLRKLDRGAIFPSCKSLDRHVGIDGWGAIFQFPRIPDVIASKQGSDIDYGARSYYINTKSGPKGILHRSGPMWGSGIPSDQDVWRSVAYEEVSYDIDRVLITDARGKLPNGNWWRSLGKFGESAFYSEVDDETAGTLNQVLNGACIRPSALP